MSHQFKAAIDSESERLIALVTDQVRGLLKEYWLEILAYRDRDKPIKGTVGFAINCRSLDYEVTAALAYGIRIKRQTMTVLDNGTQEQFNFGPENKSPETTAL